MVKVFTKPAGNLLPILHGPRGLAIKDKDKADVLVETLKGCIASRRIWTHMGTIEK